MRFLPTPPPGDQYLMTLHSVLSQHLRDMDNVAKGLQAGWITTMENGSGTAAPTTGLHQRGDFWRNTEPSELGTASSKYVILGWSCVTGGEPGTWVACRCLTGN